MTKLHKKSLSKLSEKVLTSPELILLRNGENPNSIIIPNKYFFITISLSFAKVIGK